MEEKINYEKNIYLKQLIFELLKKAKMFILIGIIFAILIIGFKYITSGTTIADDTRITYQPTTDYLGTASIFLGSKSSTSTSTAAQTYLTGYEMLEGAINKLNLDLTYEQLKSMINLNSSTDTMIIINVTGSEEKLVQDITDYIATTGSANLITKLSDSAVVMLEPAFTVYREYNAEIPSTVHSIPKLLKELTIYAIIGFVLGVFIAAAIYLFIYMTDDAIKDEKDAYVYLGIPILGTVSIIKGTKKQVEKEKRKRKLRLSQYSEQL
jgi:capsular polysaccharide biosynthesis protein